MTRADITSPRRTRIGVAIVVALIHMLAIFALIRAFAPDIPGRALRQVTEALTVIVPAPSPSPEPTPENTQEAGAAGETGRKAVPKEVAAPKPEIVLAEKKAPVPPVRSTGSADTSGARDVGQGTGAGGQGTGTGSGTGGQGQGGGGTKVVKLSGDINSARDYPRATRDLRIGSEVIVALTVGTDGRVKDCSIYRPSRDPQSDRITCDLATERFRFRPATDGAGNPIASVYHWRQWWFDPGKKSD